MSGGEQREGVDEVRAVVVVVAADDVMGVDGADVSQRKNC